MIDVIESPQEILNALVKNYPQLSECESEILEAFDAMSGAYQAEKNLFVCGNGGSAADSEHIVGELMKSFRFHRPIDKTFIGAYRRMFLQEPPQWLEGALPAFSLVSQTALSTAFSNDMSAEGIFAQQVYGYGRLGDVLLAISTSGNSPNVVEAAKVALAKGMTVISLTGSSESKLSVISNITIRVPESEVFRIQELHLPIYHALCAALEARFFGE